MEITIILPKAYPLFNEEIKPVFGGAEVLLTLLGKEIANQNKIIVNFMVADYGQKDIETYNNIRIWKSLDFNKNIFNRIFHFFKIFRKINTNIYIQITLSPFSGLISLYCKITNKKFVYMLANDGEADGTHSIYKNRITSLLTKLMFNTASLIISQNDYQKRHLNEKGIRSVTIKPGFILNDKPVNKKNYVLWVARCHPIKRPFIFLKLAKENPDMEFIMICSLSKGNEDLFSKIKQEAEKVNNLKHIDFVPISGMRRYFQEAKVLINTSKQEGFPMTFIEAASYKTPIISLNTNPDNILTESGCGFYCNNDFNLMDRNLNFIMNDKHIYDEVSSKAFNYVQKNHEVKKIKNKFLKALLKMV